MLVCVCTDTQIDIHSLLCERSWSGLPGGSLDLWCWRAEGAVSPEEWAWLETSPAATLSGSLLPELSLTSRVRIKRLLRHRVNICHILGYWQGRKATLALFWSPHLFGQSSWVLLAKRELTCGSHKPNSESREFLRSTTGAIVQKRGVHEVERMGTPRTIKLALLIRGKGNRLVITILACIKWQH